MKILLQHTSTGLYFRDFDAWTPHPHEARAFDSSIDALQFCNEHQLPATKVLLKFEDSRYDTAVADCS